MKKISIDSISPKQIASLCDHTFLKRSESYRLDAVMGESPKKLREKDFWSFLEQTCVDTLSPYAVCVRSEDVKRARAFLDQNGKTTVKVVSVIGFPDGSWIDTNFKMYEAGYALDAGAEEIDVAMNYKALKGGDHSFVLHEVQQLAQLTHAKRAVIKLIIETSELSTQEIIQSCRLANHAGVDFVKTSTGYSSCGARSDQILVIKENFFGGIKISGGVTLQNVFAFLAAASRDNQISIDPTVIRLGESRLLTKLSGLSKPQKQASGNK